MDAFDFMPMSGTSRVDWMEDGFGFLPTSGTSRIDVVGGEDVTEDPAGPRIDFLSLTEGGQEGSEVADMLG